jgi:tetratricopeptide (TPR) repeat protein/glutathione synthase/RimK-type ligase-like ATP-grasp enzyme
MEGVVDEGRGEALLTAGSAAFRGGRYAEARALFGQARAVLGQGARAVTALSDYGAACSALGDHAAAREAHAAALAARRAMLGDAHPEVGASLHNLGSALRALGEGAAAERCQAEALQIWESVLGKQHPLVAKALAALGALARERGDAAAALGYAGRVLEIRSASLAPGDTQIGLALDDLGKAQSEAGDDRAALASWKAALAILRPRLGGGAGLAPLLNNCGVAARALGEWEAARDWFAQAVAANPALAVARHNLASALARLGDVPGARREREAALRQCCVFVQQAAEARARVLIPSLADVGNVPLEHILPEREFTRIWWFLAHDGTPPGAGLPDFDVVFNGIGDPDLAGVAEDRLRAFVASRPGARLLNHPDAVARTRRDRLRDTLAGIAGVEVPRTCRVSGDAGLPELIRAAAAAGIVPPLLLRPAGAHGGVGVVRVERWEDFDVSILGRAGTWYVSQFVTCCGDDGFYRKYRVAFVDRRPLPYHLAISRGWMVHYFSADMEAHDWKLAEEAGFLADPLHVLGTETLGALQAIGKRLDLDFCAMDFALLPDRTALVFEANATMLIHPERDTGRLSFKTPAVKRILDAVASLVADHRG